jgi:hypothetical protein
VPSTKDLQRGSLLSHGNDTNIIRDSTPKRNSHGPLPQNLTVGSGKKIPRLASGDRKPVGESILKKGSPKKSAVSSSAKKIVTPSIFAAQKVSFESNHHTAVPKFNLARANEIDPPGFLTDSKITPRKGTQKMPLPPPAKTQSQ